MKKILFYLMILLFAVVCSADDRFSPASGRFGRHIEPSIIVAANNSSVDGKLSALFVCDGIADDVQIRQAFEEAEQELIRADLGSVFETSAYNTNFYDANNSKYVMYLGSKKYTSDDGLTWDAGTALSGDLTVLTTGCVWIESDTWYCLERNDADIDLFTSSDGIAWTADAGNPVMSEDANSWDDSTALDPMTVIKVDSTYYLYYNTVGKYPRETGIATSSDLTTWTKDARNPIFTGNRFCGTVFKLGSYYYYMTSHFTAYHHADGDHAGNEECELYRCATPTFYPEDREYLGIIFRCKTGSDNWNTENFDTPQVYTSDIERTEYPSATTIQCAYFATNDAGTSNGIGMFTVDSSYITSLTPKGKTSVVTFLAGTYNLTESIFPMDGAIVNAQGAVFNFTDTSNTAKACLYPSENLQWNGGMFINSSEIANPIGIYYKHCGDNSLIRDAAFNNFHYTIHTDMTRDAKLEKCVFYPRVDETYSIYLDKLRSIEFKDCYFKCGTESTATVYIIGDGIKTVFDSCTFENVDDKSKAAINWAVAASFTKFQNCVIKDFTSTFMLVRYANVHVLNNYFDNCGRCVDFYNNDCRGLVSGNYMTNCVDGRDPINIQASCAGAIIINNWIDTLHDNGVKIASDVGHIVKNNHIDAATATIVNDTTAGSNNMVSDNYSY